MDNVITKVGEIFLAIFLVGMIIGTRANGISIRDSAQDVLQTGAEIVQDGDLTP